MNPEECAERIRLMDEYSQCLTDYGVQLEALKAPACERNAADWRNAGTLRARTAGGASSMFCATAPNPGTAGSRAMADEKNNALVDYAADVSRNATVMRLQARVKRVRTEDRTLSILFQSYGISLPHSRQAT